MFVILLFILKRKDIYLFSLGMNLAHSYEEISNSFIKIFKNILFLILMMVILSTVFEKLTLEYVSSWTRTIISDYDVIIGVFLASLLSIIVHSWLNYARKRMEIRKNSAALFNDMKNIFNALYVNGKI
jgi:divalent metal cation (Fe/Co/Zn/Cd) transporter